MDYINYFDKLSMDSIASNDEKYHNLRCCYRLYKILGRYINTCFLQFNRIEQSASIIKSSGSRLVPSDELVFLEQIFSDIHFLLISMEKCYKLESELYKHLFGEISYKELKSSKQYDDIRIMRNTLEHMEENLVDEHNNDRFGLGEPFKKTGFSWLEYQSCSIKNGDFIIKDRTLTFSKMMFNDILKHFYKIIEEMQRIYDLLSAS